MEVLEVRKGLDKMLLFLRMSSMHRLMQTAAAAGFFDKAGSTHSANGGAWEYLTGVISDGTLD